MQRIAYDLSSEFKKRIPFKINQVVIDQFDGDPDSLLVSEGHENFYHSLADVESVSGPLSTEWWIENLRPQPGRVLAIRIAGEGEPQIAVPQRTRPTKAHGVQTPVITVGTASVQGPDLVPASGRATVLLADSANLGDIYVGPDSTVSTATGFPLTPGSTLELNIDNLNDLWFIGTVSGLLLRIIVEVVI